MVVRRFKVSYICANPACRLPLAMSIFHCNQTRDVTDIWVEMDKAKSCYSCHWPMDIKSVKCLVSTDMFGTDLQGEWSCDLHPFAVYHPIPLRKAYNNISVNQHTFSLYKEIVGMGFPWKCPTCKEPMRYAEKRDSTIVG